MLAYELKTTVAELKQKMTASELADWIAFFKIKGGE